MRSSGGRSRRWLIEGVVLVLVLGWGGVGSVSPMVEGWGCVEGMPREVEVGSRS